ncbi:MAG: response regulator [Lentimicrobiaceae bacterium]|nr:response regulator [Lentimicrobiaceae bacterium]
MTFHEIDSKPDSNSTLKILVAEDNVVNQRFLVSMLNIMGHQPVSVLNGREVLEIMEVEKFDIIFMDIQMPEMSGMEATRRIIEKYPASERPFIIAITANALNSDYQRCIEAGMDDCLFKPVNLKLLQSCVQEWSEKVKIKQSAEK